MPVISSTCRRLSSLSCIVITSSYTLICSDKVLVFQLVAGPLASLYGLVYT